MATSIGYAFTGYAVGRFGPTEGDPASCVFLLTRALDRRRQIPQAQNVGGSAG